MVKMAHIWRDRIYIQFNDCYDQVVVKWRNNSWQPAFWRSSQEPSDWQVLDLDRNHLIISDGSQVVKLAVNAIGDPDRPDYLAVGYQKPQPLMSVWDLPTR